MELMITAIAGFSILLGALATHLIKDTEKMEHLSMALALGALAHCCSSTCSRRCTTGGGTGWGYSLGMLVVGIAMLKVLDLFIPDHHDTEETHDHENAAHIGIISAMAVILHNIVEGMSVYSIAMNSMSDGIIFALASPCTTSRWGC